MSDILTYIPILSLLFGSGIVATIIKIIYESTKSQNLKMQSLQLGVQAMLRDRLYQMYNYYSKKGYATIHAKENFSNLYTQYHNLGQNGVMDEIRDKFMKLPEKGEE